ncbi:plasmid replication DNA-binding protein [Acinetobacter nectaris]|uniref:plasmid replication DNA-binding protein n=1 Tax=Acinetobacter nectaris TaxID=1219382 RepID=UPI001F22095A|nr:plasmid replication DNA-binding protein [Acinetobacter nectaris]MCF9035431.1 DNA-binding protein [Acinetobacter nectaris]
MKKLSVSDLAKLYGISRQAIYAHINKGNLSKGSDGLIDFSEALRAFGEPKKQEKNVKLSQSIDSNTLTEVDTLKSQVDMLEKQLNQAISRETQSFEREIFYQAQIEAMQRLLEAPKPSSNEDTKKSDTNEINNSSSEAEVDMRKEEGSENIESIQIDNSKAERVGFWRKIFRSKN